MTYSVLPYRKDEDKFKSVKHFNLSQSHLLTVLNVYRLDHPKRARARANSMSLQLDLDVELGTTTVRL